MTPTTALVSVPAPVRPVLDGGGPVAWRMWLVRPQPDPQGELGPALTGINGTLWDGPVLHARCLRRDWQRGAYRFTLDPHVDRHHQVIPDPACSCGISAVPAPAALPRARLLVGRVPQAEGFVELGGRILAEGGELRAQWARVAGPLVLTVPPPRRSRMLPVAALGVVVRGNRYVVGRRGRPLSEWRAEVAAALSRRYAVEVVNG